MLKPQALECQLPGTLAAFQVSNVIANDLLYVKLILKGFKFFIF